MARGSVQVTYNPTDDSRLPDALTEGTSILMDLRQRGLVAAGQKRLRIRRQGGYCALDVWLLLLVFFTTGAGRGVRAFWELLRPHVLQVASVAGRRRLPSPASLSRALDAVEPELFRDSVDWLLAEVSGVDDVLRHPAVQTRDACGDGWHVFDLDPTVTTLRHRALPVHDELPEPRRRSENTGAPGHKGRKRGDIVHRRVTVQHAGSSAWVHAHLTAGNGEGVLDLERGLDAVVRTCERLGHPTSRALVRMDGEFGNVPSYAACRARGLPFVTRLNRPKFYEDPLVLERLRAATWYRVPDSLCGPRRSATDLGILTVHPGQKTRRPGGGRYEPISVRVVACVFPKKGKAKRGRTLDGMQVEFFAIDASASAWPAPDAVAAYFGRTAEENRFAQEDRELGLDRIVSYHLPGQELAALVGLSLWNLRLARGFELDPPPRRPVVQPLRCTPIDDTIPKQWPRDPVILKLLADLAPPAPPGWWFDPATAELYCEEGRPLTLTTIRRGEFTPGHTGIVFRRPTGGCEDCACRPRCLGSTRPQTFKHAEFAVPTETATRLRQRFAAVRRLSPSVCIEPLLEQPGSHAVVDSLFLPARARQTFARIFAGATLRIRVELPDEVPRPHLVAVDAADRQRRRKTWAQNVDRYALPEETTVGLEVAGSREFRRLLGEEHRSKFASEGSQ